MRRGHRGSVMVGHRERLLTESCCVLTVGSKLNIQKSVRGYAYVATETYEAMRRGSNERIRASSHRTGFGIPLHFLLICTKQTSLKDELCFVAFLSDF